MKKIHVGKDDTEDDYLGFFNYSVGIRMEDGVPSTFSPEASDHLLPPSHKVRDVVFSFIFSI